MNEWTVWSDGAKPIATNLGRAEAVRMVTELHQQGDMNVYAESDDGDVFEIDENTEY